MRRLIAAPTTFCEQPERRVQEAAPTGIQTQGRRAAQCAAPTAKADRKRWLGKARRSCGIAWPLNFCKPRARRARKESQATTQILRAGNILPDSRDNPRNGGPGVRRIWTRSVHPEPSPGDPQGELARRAKRRWPGPLVSFPSLERNSPRRAKPCPQAAKLPLHPREQLKRVTIDERFI